MARLLDILRDGNWLTLGRLRLWALAVLVASAAGLVYLAATSDGLNDYQGGRSAPTSPTSTWPARKSSKAGRRRHSTRSGNSPAQSRCSGPTRLSTDGTI